MKAIVREKAAIAMFYLAVERSLDKFSDITFVP